jgi:phenylacetate-coenzyme A ligase PaaK-like adenylate-forming protein
VSNQAVTLRSVVAVGEESGVLTFTDQDIGLTIDLEVEGAESLFTGPDRRRIDTRATYAADVIAVLSAAGMLEEKLSASDLRRRQTLFQLNQMLDFVREEIPYYQSPAYGGPMLESLQEIAQFPLFSKTELRAHLLELVPRHLDVGSEMAKGEITLGSSSGSTGERLQAFVGKEVGQSPALYDQVWFGSRRDRRSRMAVLTTPICSPTVCHLGRASFEERLTDEGTALILNSSEDLFSVDRRRVEQFATELDRFRPDLFMFNPVYLHWFARRAREWGIALPPVGLLISCYQYRSRAQTRGLHQHFPGPIYDWYGCTEASAGAGQECPQGRLHVRAEQCLVEVVKEGQVVAPGTMGSLALTTIAARTMPLVRYLVGDIGVVDESPCDCLLDGCPSIVLHGRGKDMMYLDDRWVTTRQFDDVIGETKDLDFYACRQPDERSLLVQVVPALGQEATFAKRELADKLSSTFRVPRVTIEVVRRLDPLPGSLKFGLTACQYREPPACP